MFEDDDEDALGYAEVFTGLHRPKLMWPGMDARFLLAAFACFLLSALSAYGVRDLKIVGTFLLIFVALGVLILAIGFIMGRWNPYALDELSQYLALRVERWGFVAGDDAGHNFKGVEEWR